MFKNYQFRWWHVPVAAALLFVLWYFAIMPAYYWLTAVPKGTDHTEENAKLSGENDSLRAQNEALRKEILDAKAAAEVEKAAKEKLAKDLEKYGAKAQEGADAQKKATEDYEKKIAEINVDASAAERCAAACAARGELGAIYACKPDPDTYCRQRTQ